MNLNIPESHVAPLKEAYTKIYSTYLEKKAALDHEWSEMEPILKTLGLISSATKTFSLKALEATINKGDYSPSLSWLQKCKAILRIKGKAMTSNELIEAMVGEFETTMNKTSAINSLPATLSVAAKENKIDRRLRTGSNEFEYFVK